MLLFSRLLLLFPWQLLLLLEGLLLPGSLLLGLLLQHFQALLLVTILQTLVHPGLHLQLVQLGL